MALDGVSKLQRTDLMMDSSASSVASTPVAGSRHVSSRFVIQGKSVRTFVLPESDKFTAHQIETMRWWEVKFAAWLYESAARGNRDAAFVDVGANFGTTSVMAADFFSKIYAFEMEEGNCRLFEEAMAVNAIDYELFRCAVSDAPGERQAFVYKHNAGAHSLVRMRDDADMAEISVKSMRLDDLDPSIRNVRFVHVDTEGHDIRVLMGGRDFFRRQDVPPFIQIEFCPMTLSRHGSSISDLTDFMDQFGYEAHMNCTNVLGKLSRHTLSEMFFQWAKDSASLDLVLLPTRAC